MKKKTILGICIVLVLFCAIGTVSAKTWYVDTYIMNETCRGDFIRISDAIENASDGDTIIVKRSLYREHIELNKALTLKGANKPSVERISINVNGCVVDGFRIWNTECDRCAGISVNSNNNIITNNYIDSGTRGAPEGVKITSKASRNIITNNIIKDNFGNGLTVSGTFNTIVNNTITSNNQAGYINDFHGGIYVTGKNNVFYLNTIANNRNYNVHATAPNFWNSTEKLSYKFNGQDYTDYLGNYWDCTDDMNGDGIIDKHRQIDENNVDYKPLMANVTVKLSELPSPYEIPILEEKNTETPTTKIPPEEKTTPKVPTEEKTTPEVPEGEEKGIPGFEAVFAIAGLLAVVYILMRRNK